ncbi:hypothetical protein GCM10017767_16850 [Halomonas urumqiensis]|nr:hypothetical protein GCM10017767_16850 [Halomonas urumqiensis]
MKASGSLENHAGGTLAAEGELYISTSQSHSNAGHIRAQGVQANGDWFENTAGTLQADQLNVEVGTANLSGGTVLADTATLSSTKHIQDSKAQLYTQGELHLKAQRLSNAGEIQSSATSHIAVVNHLTNTGTLAAADDLTIDAASVDSSGTLAAGLNSDGSLDTFVANGAELHVTTTGDLSATGTNLAAGTLTLDGDNVDLSDSQTSASSAEITARSDLDTWQSDVVTQESLLLQSDGTLDNTEGTLSSQQGDLSVQALSLNNDQGELLAENDLSITLNEALSNTDGTVYAGSSTALETGALTNTGSIAAADDLTIDAASVDSSGTLAAGLNSDGSLDTFDANGAELHVTTTGDLSASGTNLASGTLTLDGDNVDLSDSQTSASSAEITARSDLATWQADVVTQESLSLQSDGALDNTGGTLSSQASDLTVQALSLINDQGELLAGNALEVALSEALSNTDGTLYAGGNTTLGIGSLTNTGTLAAADDLIIDATSVDSSGTLAAGLNQVGTLKAFTDGGDALSITTTGDLRATGTNLAAGTLTLQGNSLDLSDSQTSAYRADITARGDLDTWQADVVTQEGLSLMAHGALDNTEGTLSSQQGVLSVQALSLNNDQGELLAGSALEVALREALRNADGTLYAGSYATVDTGAFTNTGTVAAVDDLIIDASSVESSGTLAAGLNQDGTLKPFAEGGDALSVTTTGGLSATGTNLAAGTLTLQGDHFDLSESQTSAFDAHIAAKGALDTGSANIVTQESLSLQAGSALDNTKGTLSSQEGDLSVQALSLNNDRGELLAENDLSITLSEALSNTDGTVYAGSSTTLEAGALTNTGSVAAADDLTIDAASVDSSGTLAAGLNEDGTLKTFADVGGALSVTTAGNLSATGTNLAAGTLSLDGDNVDLSDSQTSASSAEITARSDLDTWQANVVTQESLSLQADGALDNTEGALSSRQGDLSVQAQSLNNTQGELLAGNDLEAIFSGALNNTNGTAYAGGDATLEVGALTNTGTLAAEDDLIIGATSVDSIGTLAAGLNSDGSLDTFGANGAELRVTTTGDLSASGTNLASGRLALAGGNVDLSESQTSAYRADITSRSDLATWQTNVVTQESLSLQVDGALYNTEGTLSSQKGDLRVRAFRLNNTDGTVYAGGNANLETGGAIDNTQGTLYSEQGDLSLQALRLHNTEGTVYAGGNTSLDTDTLTSTGTIAAADDLTIDAANVGSSGTLAAGLNQDGTLEAFAEDGGALSVTTAGDLSATGTNLAAGRLILDADNADLSESQTSAYRADITSRSDLATWQANVVTQESLSLQADGVLDNSEGTLSSQASDLTVQALSLINDQGEVLAGNDLSLTLSEALSNNNGTLYAGGNTILGISSLTNTGTIAAAEDLTIDAANVGSSGTLAAGLKRDGTLKAFAEGGDALSVTATEDLSATGTNLAAGTLILQGNSLDLSDSQTSAYRADLIARGDLDTWQSDVVTQESLSLQVDGALDNSDGTLSSQQGDLSVQALSLNNNQGELLAGNALGVALSEALSNTDGTLFAGSNATLDAGALTNTGTFAAAGDLTIDATRVESSGTLAAGLNEDGTLKAFADDDSGALSVIATEGLSATGTNLAAGTLTLDGDHVDLSESQTSAYDAAITARSDLATWQADVVTQENLSLQAGGALDNTEGTVSSQQGDLNVQALSLNNDRGELLAGNDLSVTLSEALSNTDGTLYAGSNATLDAGALTNTGTLAAADDLTIDAASVDSSGTLAAGLNEDGTLKTFADGGGALRITTTGDLSATGTNLAAGTLTLDGDHVGLSESQTSAFDAHITAKGALDTGSANIVTQESLSLQVDGVLDNSEGTLSSQQGDLSAQALSLNNDRGELLAGNGLSITLSEILGNTDGTLYSGGNTTLDTGALTSTGTLAAANDLTIDAASVDSSGTLAAGLNEDGTLNAFIQDGGALSVTTTGDLSATGTNLAAGTLTLQGNSLDLSESQTSAYGAAITSRSDLATWQANVVTQESLSLQADGVLDNSEGTLSSQASDLNVQALSLTNDQGELLAGNALDVALSEALSNTDGIVYAGGNTTLGIGALTNTGTIAAADDLTIDTASIESSGTLAAGLNEDGTLKAFADDVGALSITATEDLSATGNNLAAGRLTLDGNTVDLSDSQTSAFDAHVTANGVLNTGNTRLITRDDISIWAQNLNNIDGTVYAGGNATLDSDALTNTGTLAAADDLAINATHVASSGTLAAGLNEDGTLKAFADDVGALSVTATEDLSITGNNLATGRLTLSGDHVDLSDSQTSAFDARVTAKGMLNTGNARLITRDDISIWAQNLNNIDGTVYAGGNTILDTGALTNTGTLAAADDLAIDATRVASSGTLAAGLNEDGTLKTFAGDGGALHVTSTGDLSATGNNLAAGHLTLDGVYVDLSNSQTSANNADIIARGDLDTWQANVVTQEGLSLLAGGALDNTKGALSSQQDDLSVQARSLTNNQGRLLAGNELEVTLGEALSNNDGTVYAGGNTILDTGALTNTGTIAAAGDLAIDATSVSSNGTLAGGLNADGSLNAFGANGAALRVTTVGDLSATGNNLAAGTLTLQGNSLDLSESQTSAFDAHVTAKGTLDADIANFITRNDINIEAQILNNMGGTVYAGSSATLDTEVLANTGILAAADDLAIHAVRVESNGTLAAGLNEDGTLKAFTQDSGALSVTATGDLSATGNNLAAGRLSLEGDALNLSNSQASAYNADIIARGDLDTSQANVVTQKGLSLQADGALGNEYGALASKTGSLTFNANGVTNTDGLMAAATELNINANSKSINNISGEILAQGDMNLSTRADILNTGGIVQSNAAISLSADIVNNRQTSGDAQGIVGDDVQINADSLDNTEGQVLAGRDLTITADHSINNTHGTLNAQRHLDLQDGVPSSDTRPGKRSLIISNTDGVIVANNESASADASVAITANTLGLDGTLESGGDMALDLVGDLNTASGQQVTTEGVLSLRLHGDTSGNTFDNAGKWEGGRGLIVRADEIRNQSSGELQSLGITSLDTTQTSGGSVTNRGLINGTDTRISSRTVDNVGRGRVYGDRVAIKADTLTNREETVGGQAKAATIAARERLDIGAKDITNREDALIFSAGDMAIGGTLSPFYRAVVDGTSNALILNNNSATIESLGNMVLATDTLRNTNEYFAIEEAYLGTTEMTMIQPEGSSAKFIIDDDEIILTPPIGWSKELNGGTLVWVQDERPEGYVAGYPDADPSVNLAGDYVYYHGSGEAVISEWKQYLLERKEYESTVVSSAPGQIMAGGNLTLRGKDLLNDKSRIIVGRALHGDLGNLKNQGAMGEKRVSTEGLLWESTIRRITNGHTDSMYGGATYRIRSWEDLGDYNPPDETTTIGLGIGEVRENTAYSGSGTYAGDKADLGIAGSVSIGDTSTTASTLAEQNASNVANGVDKASDRTSAVSTDSQAVTQASVNAATVDHANSPGYASNSANAVNSEAHGATEAAFSTNSSGNATSSANAVNTEAHGATGASFSANSSGNAISGTNAVNTDTNGATEASFRASHSGDVTNSTNAVNTDAHGATGTSFSADNSGNVTNSANAVNTASQGARGASLSANTPSSATQGAAGISLDHTPLDRANPSQRARATVGLGTQTGPALLLPNSSLFTIDPGVNARYLVETDPQFTDHRQWLSSEYLLSALAFDPAHTQKRLGDGFYEQKLIREQVAALTGYRFLGDYSSDDAQYAALMNAGSAFAHEHNLRPGIALTAAQTAQLTNDIVWLVTQAVQLPDGSTTTALMPKVYLAPRQGDLAANGELLGGHDGTLISARDIDLALSGDLNNSGTIAGRKMVDISTRNLSNSGHLQGDITLINARKDIDIEGGSVAANTGMALQAGRDLNITTTTHSATNETDGNTFSLQGIDRVAGLYVNGEAGELLASAGGSINLTAAELHNIGSGVTQLNAGGDINLDTVEIGQSHDLNWGTNNYNRQRHSEDIGTVITGEGAVGLNAGQDINLRAAEIDAQGALAVNAIDGNITLEAGQRLDSLAEGRQTSSSGLFSSKTTITRSSRLSTQALASELGGQTVAMTSGQDIYLNGANVLADQDLGIHAGGNLTLDAAQHTLSESHFTDTRKSGLFSGGFGFTIGSQQQQSDATSTATFAAPSTVGSIGGNVTLSAGDTYTQVGSDVLAPAGDILIGANTVDIREGRESTTHQTEHRFKQSGLSVSLSNPVVDTAQRLEGQLQAAGDTRSPRMKALAAANSALAVSDIQQQLQGGQGTDLTLNVSLGSSQSHSNSTALSNTARGSTLAAGDNLALHAGNLTVQGSKLEAGNQTLLNATQDINLLASADTASHRSSHNSSSASIGLGIGMNGGSPGIALNLDASRAKGHGNSDSTTYTNTQVTAGNQVILNSGGDTTLQGAVVSAPQITTNIGGDLSIASLQDTATHNERHSSSGFSASVPLIGAGQPSASLNASRTQIDGDYQSVKQQSGLRAGDGGFQVNVEGTTSLTGGAITSTQTAIDNDLNRFSTAGQSARDAIDSGALTLTDIANRASVDADSASIGLSTGEDGAGLSGIGTGRVDGNASSTTVAAISGLAGHQAARTGDADTGIEPIFDAESVKQDVQAQAAITQEFGSKASQLVGDLAQAKREEERALRLHARQAQAAGDTERAGQLNAQADRLQRDWGDNGTQRLAAHTAIGALTGGTAGATGAAVGTLSTPAVADVLNEAGLDDTLADGLAALASTVAGAATGGTQGGAAAVNEVLNNYLTTRSINQELERLTADDSELDPALIRRLVEHQLLYGLQENAPLDDCRVVGSDCSPQLDEMTAAFELLQDPRTREKFRGDLTDDLIERQLNDLVATLESVDWSKNPETIARAEFIGNTARAFVDTCALHPLAGPCRGVALAITGSDVTGKINDGDLTGALVQGGAFLAGQSAASIVKGSIQNTGIYSKEFIEWTKNIYGAGTEKMTQAVYDETQSAPDTDDE